MARRKTGLLDDLASLPWYIGATLGVLAFGFIHQIGGVLTPLAWVFLAACWVAALVSFLRGLQRSRLLETQIGLDSLTRMNWREFEMLVGEAFRRRGFFVEENGLGGKDGGIDLIISKDGRPEIVQCKQWRSRRVSAPTVREMWGLADHHHVDGVRIVCIGDYTPDAAAFARGKPIELITGERLLELVREVQRPSRDATAVSPRVEPALHPEAPNGPPPCPSCGASMVQRHNRQTRAPFWGCTAYPRCRGTRPA